MKMVKVVSWPELDQLLTLAEKRGKDLRATLREAFPDMTTTEITSNLHWWLHHTRKRRTT